MGHCSVYLMAVNTIYWKSRQTHVPQSVRSIWTVIVDDKLKLISQWNST